jgi:hypothetical protein
MQGQEHFSQAQSPDFVPVSVLPCGIVQSCGNTAFGMQRHSRTYATELKNAWANIYNYVTPIPSLRIFLNL